LEPGGQTGRSLPRCGLLTLSPAFSCPVFFFPRLRLRPFNSFASLSRSGQALRAGLRQLDLNLLLSLPCPTGKCRAFGALSSDGPEEHMILRLFQTQRDAGVPTACRISTWKSFSRENSHSRGRLCHTCLGGQQTGVLLVHMLRRQNQSARSLTPAHALTNARVR
jgi:hypothetical protein